MNIIEKKAQNKILLSKNWRTSCLIVIMWV